jgi:hypothetical protein
LPFVLTVVLIRSVTLFTSTLGAVRTATRGTRRCRCRPPGIRRTVRPGARPPAGPPPLIGPEQGHEPHACFRRRRRTRLGQRRLDGRPRGGNAREAEGGFARAWIDRRRIGGRRGRGCDGRLGQLAMGRRRSGHGVYCVCQPRADRSGISARNCRPAGPDRRRGILDPGPLEAAEPRSAPPGNSDRSAQQHQHKLPRPRHRSPRSATVRHRHRTGSIRKAKKLRVIIFQKGVVQMQRRANASACPQLARTRRGSRAELFLLIGQSGLDPDIPL